ncbi:hypothetical protein BC831DRAFT_441019 [Entophlyctis helioformis]|nr:hypothetical protein BC831DRAFT_441019 [Entophlyctis helioformis]
MSSPTPSRPTPPQGPASDEGFVLKGPFIIVAQIVVIFMILVATITFYIYYLRAIERHQLRRSAAASEFQAALRQRVVNARNVNNDPDPSTLPSPPPPYVHKHQAADSNDDAELNAVHEQYELQSRVLNQAGQTASGRSRPYGPAAGSSTVVNVTGADADVQAILRSATPTPTSSNTAHMLAPPDYAEVYGDAASAGAGTGSGARGDAARWSGMTFTSSSAASNPRPSSITVELVAPAALVPRSVLQREREQAEAASAIASSAVGSAAGSALESGSGSVVSTTAATASSLAPSASATLATTATRASTAAPPTDSQRRAQFLMRGSVQPAAPGSGFSGSNGAA